MYRPCHQNHIIMLTQNIFLSFSPHNLACTCLEYVEKLRFMNQIHGVWVTKSSEGEAMCHKCCTHARSSQTTCACKSICHERIDKTTEAYNDMGECWILVRSWKYGCLVTWFCYQMIAKPGNKTAQLRDLTHIQRCLRDSSPAWFVVLIYVLVTAES